MPSSRSMSRRLPRLRRKVSRRCSCSRVSRPKRPTVNSPSIVVPHSPQRSRVTASSLAQTGQVAMTSCGTDHPRCRTLAFSFLSPAYDFVKTSTLLPTPTSPPTRAITARCARNSRCASDVDRAAFQPEPFPPVGTDCVRPERIPSAGTRAVPSGAVRAAWDFSRSRDPRRPEGGQATAPATATVTPSPGGRARTRGTRTRRVAPRDGIRQSSVLLARDRPGELGLRHPRAAANAEVGRPLVQLIAGVAHDVHAPEGLAWLVARSLSAAGRLRIGRPVVVLRLPVVADLLERVLER